ncbi:calcium-responsive transcription factor-like isoform X2 [Dreissena polymorpha]|uniref:calcium-responsive transcription factor-like isoform X2 n=1 Tax=Dreissena polymorpha TaxID=45954 RepID=UPI0022650001|nr:calcium-responsive transcription factor-like isoform X2 [Dreissena polymorpha]XP_052236831.1 calcium-responsive transcription factor-like isoform X2 [Dreissena polymorpha]XP_052236841.1 calcium-responsive transcription factor-like isoform X2 [Dreissena polymorpha]
MISTDDQITCGGQDGLTSVIEISPSNVLSLSPGGLADDDNEVVSSTGGLANQAVLVSPTMSNETLQSLLASPSLLQSHGHLGLLDGIHIILPGHTGMFPAHGTDSMLPRIWHVINPDDGIITVAGDSITDQGETEPGEVSSTTGHMDLMDTTPDDLPEMLMPPPTQPLPVGCPSWAARLKNCEKIGDYYRGYVDTEVEMDILLTYHKQATQSFWGTRQSPSPAKQSTRFMWKSQYVPFDGVPFVNAGSRAVVMECQFGPRRKGGLAKKALEMENNEYRQTCPARIYIKKVRKFPEFRIDPNLDKRAAKIAMDKAFHALKQQNIDKIGQDRFYAQLPTVAAHEFHEEIANRSGMHIGMSQRSQSKESQTPPDIVSETQELENRKKQRLHPLVAQKIRDIVSNGEAQVYHVRRQLRMYVCRDLLSASPDSHISRHDLSLFPTITDLKNHIHQAVKDIENGTLPLTATGLNHVNLDAAGSSNDSLMTDLWSDMTSMSSGPIPETVTVTLTQAPGEDGEHVISRIETHMSDGSTQISTTLTPETAQLLARLNPHMFPPASLSQLKVQSAEHSGGVDIARHGLALTPDMDHSNAFSGLDIQDSETNLSNTGPILSINIQQSDPMVPPDSQVDLMDMNTDNEEEDL